MCIRGSASSSTIFRSSSTSSPSVSHASLFAEFAREVADQPDHFLKQRSDWNHSHGHRGPLYFVGNARELRKIPRKEFVAFDLQTRIVAHQRLRNHHLADHVHEKVELIRVNLNGSRRDLRFAVSSA